MTGDQAHCELAIIGAGVIGCAIAARLSGGLDPPGSEILLIELAAREGMGISSRNSGVVHAGLYHPPDSRKARACVAGNARIWEWVGTRGVPHRITGKLVVATEPDHEAQLEWLRTNARACGALLEPITLAQARTLEPMLPATIRAACWSPRSGIVDASALVRSLRVEAERAGIGFVGNAKVEQVEPTAAGFAITTTRGRVIAKRVVNAAGLGAVALANAISAATPQLARQQTLARGDYFRLRRPSGWQRLIYPVTTPGSAALGIHLTLELDEAGRLGSSVRLGPDLDWIDELDEGPARGIAKQAKFLAAAERLLGPLDPRDLDYDGCGIRPKLVGPGQPNADFELVEYPPGCWHLLGIESPGLTASLALADELAAALTAGGGL